MSRYDMEYNGGAADTTSKTKELAVALATAAATAVAAAAANHFSAQSNTVSARQDYFVGGMTGGCSCGGVFGGNEVNSLSKVAEYNNSISSRIKQNHISELISVFEGIGVVFSNRNDINAILRDISMTIPGLDKKGSDNPFNKKMDRQPEVVEKLVNVVNIVMKDMYGIEKLIDSNVKSEDALAALIKWATTLRDGYLSEYSLVKNALTELIENIGSADSITDYIYKKIADLESKKPNEFNSLKNLYQKSRDLYKEHMNRLKEFLKIETNSGFANYGISKTDGYDNFEISNGRLSLSVKSPEFGDAVSYLLSLLKSNLELASDLEKQIKDLGINLNQSIKDLSLDEFEDQVIRKIRMLNNSSTNEDVKRYEKAKKAIRDTFVALKKTGGSELSYSVGKTIKTEESQYEKRTNEGLEFIREYVRAIGNNYSRIFVEMRNFMTSVTSSSERIDIGVVSDSFSNLASLLESNAMIDVELLELSEFSTSKNNKELYIGYINALVRALKDYGARNSSANVTSVCTALDEVIATVEHYSTLIRSKNVNLDKQVIFSVVRRATDDVRKGIYETLYRIYLHNMRVNLLGVNKDIESKSENYEKIIGEALATVIAEINTTINDLTKKINDISGPTYASLKRDIIAKYRARINFYKAIQAIDLYIKKFTLSATRMPPTNIDMQKLLSSTQLIANWFNDETGTDLAKLFDVADFLYDKDGTTGDKFDPDNYIGNHYYSVIASSAYAPTGEKESYEDKELIPNMYDTCKELNNSVYDKFQGLKNIVNMFSRIIIDPSEVGGVFMTPNQIYVALVEFMKSVTFKIDVKEDGSKKIVATINSLSKTEDVKELSYFTSTITAMAAKIITTLRLYDMQTQTVPICDIMKTRMVLGGGSSTRDKLDYIPEASDYYFRLPRLAEFYIKMFYTKKTDLGDINLSMIPDMDGIFSELISYIWKYRMDSDEFSGKYYETEIMDLVLIINRIYKFYTKEGSVGGINTCIADFVKNMNRKFVLLTRNEANNVLINMKKRTDNYSIKSNNNIAILPGETQQLIEEVMNLPAPSDAYLTGPKAKTDFTYDMASVKKAVDSFMNRFGNELGRCSEIRSFKSYIKQKESDMKSNPSDDQRLAAVTSLINVTKNLDKSAIDTYMFHETVILGLDSLNRVITRASALDTASKASYDDAKQALDYILNTCANEESNLFDFKIDAGRVELQYGKLKRRCESLLEFIKQLINKFRNTVSYEIINKYEGQDADISVRAISDRLEKLFDSPNSTMNANIKYINQFIEDGNFQDHLSRYIYGKGGDSNYIPPAAVFKTATHTIYGPNLCDKNDGASFIKCFNKALNKYVDTLIGDSENLSFPSKSVFSNLIVPFYNGFLLKESSHDAFTGVLRQITIGSNPTNLYVIPSAEPIYNSVRIKAEILLNTSQYSSQTKNPEYLTNILTEIPSVYRDMIKCRAPLLISSFKFFTGAAEILEKLLKSDFQYNITEQSTTNPTTGTEYKVAGPGNLNGGTLTQWRASIATFATNSEYCRAVAQLYGNDGYVTATESTTDEVLLEFSQGKGGTKWFSRYFNRNELVNATVKSANRMYTTFNIHSSTLLTYENSISRTTNSYLYNETQEALNKIVNCSHLASTILAQGLREIGDNPVFLETGENGMDFINTRRGKSIVTPISLVNSVCIKELNLPYCVKFSDPLFGFLYGSRLLLSAGQKIRAQHIPSSIKSLTTMNSMRNEADSMPEAEFLNYIQQVFDLTRPLINYSFMCCASEPQPSVVYPSRNDNFNELMNSIFKDATIFSDICQFVSGKTTDAVSDMRLNENVASIVEMNIMPLNIHALMQSVPLINILNYSAAFNMYTKQLYGSTKSIAVQKMLTLVTAPFENDNDYSPYSFEWHRTFMGGDNYMKDRPKFISDQIYLKALYGTAKLSGDNFKGETDAVYKAIYETLKDAVNIYITNGYTENDVKRDLDSTVGFYNIDTTSHKEPLVIVKIMELKFDTLIRGIYEYRDKISDRGSDILQKYITNFPNTTKDIDFKILHDVYYYAISRLAFAIYSLQMLVNGQTNHLSDYLKDITSYIEKLDGNIYLFEILDPSDVVEVKKLKASPTYDAMKRECDALFTNSKVKTINFNDAASTLSKQYYSHTPSYNITYYQKDGNDKFYGVDAEVISSLTTNICVNASKFRFNTVIVKNLLFISEVQRILRLAISRSMTVSNSQLLTATGNASTTEYGHDPFFKLEQVDDAPFTRSQKYELEKF